MGDSRSPVIAVVPKSKVCASAPNSDPIQVASVVSLLVRLEGDHSDEVASATEVSKLGFIGEAVTNQGKGDKNHTPMASDLSVGTMVRLWDLGMVFLLIIGIRVLLKTIFFLCESG